MSLETQSKNYTLELIRNRFKNGLILFSLRNILSRTGIDISPYYWVREGSLNFDVPKIKDKDTSYKFEFLQLADLEAMRSMRLRYNKSEMIEGMKRGQKCIALKESNNVAAFMFIEYNSFVSRGKKFVLGEKDAYLLNMYTLNNYRGRNLAPFLRYKSYELLKEEGIENIYSISEYFNYSSRKFKEKLKAKNTSLYLSILLFKKKKWTFKLRDFG
nr:hypothetical protein [uncultured Allomuricauda sp.]